MNAEQLLRETRPVLPVRIEHRRSLIAQLQSRARASREEQWPISRYLVLLGGMSAACFLVLLQPGAVHGPGPQLQFAASRMAVRDLGLSIPANLKLPPPLPAQTASVRMPVAPLSPAEKRMMLQILQQ